MRALQPQCRTNVIPNVQAMKLEFGKRIAQLLGAVIERGTAVEVGCVVRVLVERPADPR